MRCISVSSVQTRKMSEGALNLFGAPKKITLSGWGWVSDVQKVLGDFDLLD